LKISSASENSCLAHPDLIRGIPVNNKKNYKEDLNDAIDDGRKQWKYSQRSSKNLLKHAMGQLQLKTEDILK